MARIRIRDATNTLRTLTRLRIRDASNVLRTVQRVRMRDAGNVLRTVFQALSATLSPTSLTPTGTTPTITTSACVATPSGGTGPYTYLWSYTFHDSATLPTINFGTTSGASFSQGSMVSTDIYNATAVCTVTDTASGVSAVTNTVTIQWYRT